MKCWVVSIYVKSLDRWVQQAYSDRLEALAMAFNLSNFYRVKLQKRFLGVVELIALRSIDGRRV